MVLAPLYQTQPSLAALLEHVVVGEADSWVALGSDVAQQRLERPSDILNSLQDQCWDLHVEEVAGPCAVSPCLHGDLTVY